MPSKILKRSGTTTDLSWFWSARQSTFTFFSSFVLSRAFHIGLFQFLSAQWYGRKNPGVRLIMIFSRVFCLKVYFYKGWICTDTFFVVGNWKLFSGIIFFWGTELSKIKFQGIYESNDHSFQSAWFLKVWSSIPMYE